MWLCNSIKSSSWHAFNRPCKSFLGKNRHVTTINDIRDIWHLRIKKTDNTYTSLHAPHNQPSGRKFKVKEKKKYIPFTYLARCDKEISFSMRRKAICLGSLLTFVLSSSRWTDPPRYQCFRWANALQVDIQKYNEMEHKYKEVTMVTIRKVGITVWKLKTKRWEKWR